MLILEKLLNQANNSDEELRTLKAAVSEVEAEELEEAERHFDSLFLMNPDNYLYAYMRGFCKITSTRNFERVDGFYKFSKITGTTIKRILRSEYNDQDKVQMIKEILKCLKDFFFIFMESSVFSKSTFKDDDIASFMTSYYDAIIVDKEYKEMLSNESWDELNRVIFKYAYEDVMKENFSLHPYFYSDGFTKYISTIDSEKARKYKRERDEIKRANEAKEAKEKIEREEKEEALRKNAKLLSIGGVLFAFSLIILIMAMVFMGMKSIPAGVIFTLIGIFGEILSIVFLVKGNNARKALK